ncbi:MAG: OsmC family protein [Bacteroidales bacterium]|jgi:putative redox protein|nr:OsmC family protein [Bacteroidales bacterium]
MEKSLTLNWLNGMAFESEINGHKITIDADESVGGNNIGPRPKPLMLLSLAGCTGMDVVSILKKMRVELDNFAIEIESEMSDEHPKHYTKLNVIYKFWGKDLPMEKLEKAVSLSDERYCGVSVVYKKAIEMSYEIRLNPEK